MGSQNDFSDLKAYFRPLGAKICPNFRFYKFVLISDKNTEFDLSQGVMNSFISKIKKIHPLFTVLADFTKFGNVPNRAVRVKKNILFSDKKRFFLKLQNFEML